MHRIIHAIEYVKYFNTIEPAFFAQSASGYFLARAKKKWFRLNIQPECIRTIIMA